MRAKDIAKFSTTAPLGAMTRNDGQLTSEMNAWLNHMITTAPLKGRHTRSDGDRLKYLLGSTRGIHIVYDSLTGKI